MKPTTFAFVLAVAMATGGDVTAAAAPESKAPAAETPALNAAKKLFERYVALEQAFDPMAADLYSDEAVIQNRRKYPSGEIKVMSLPAPKYKAMIRAVMPAAKARKDTNTYSDVRYTAEGAGVRITAKRFSDLKKYTSPLSMLVKPDAGGTWLIYEELSESQP